MDFPFLTAFVRLQRVKKEDLMIEKLKLKLKQDKNRIVGWERKSIQKSTVWKLTDKCSFGR